MTGAAKVVKSGYLIAMKGAEVAQVAEPLLTCTGDTPLDGYHVTADPATPGVSGVRFFGTTLTA